jgi:hypothetical protein
MTDYAGTEEEPKTYTNEKFIVTDTRSLEPNMFQPSRTEKQRPYLERHKEGRI